MIRAANLNHLWATLVIEELVRSGVVTYCIAPGSRSAPLTVAVARHNRASGIVHFDERGAAFHALGYGRATNTPAAIVTTSGSALANVWPAVVEASLDHVPLLVLSGDRPPELQDAGANQTMDQVKFFGGFVQWAASLPCPSTSIDPAMVLTTVDQAVSRCRGPVRGAVHINFMLREPLAPTGEHACFDSYLTPVRRWTESGRPYTQFGSAVVHPTRELLNDISAAVGFGTRGIVVAGRLAGSAERRAVSGLAASLGWPLLPDITSGLRLDSTARTAVHRYETLLGSEAFMQRHPVDTVLQIGGRLTSKRLLKRLESGAPEHYVLIDDQPERHDPAHRVTQRHRLPVTTFCEALRGIVGAVGDAGWLESWQTASELAEARFNAVLSQRHAVSEPGIAWFVSRCIGAGEGLFLASSMPIRDMGTYGCARDEPVEVGANRGASGIDGTIAAAAGFARGLGKPVTLVTGDLAMLHDLNSLGLLRSLETPMVIVLLNNDGGGIFSFLPIVEISDVFEDYFGTPHGMTFEHAAALFGLDYARPSTIDEFVADYESARRRSGATLIEVQTRRQENRDLQMSLQEAASRDVCSHWADR